MLKVLFIVIFFLLFIFSPIFSIWAVNLLFELTIPVTLTTWFSVFWLHLVLGSGRIGKAIEKYNNR